MRPALSFVILVAACTPAFVQAQSRPSIDAAWRELAAEFHAEMDARRLVGGSIWLARGNQVLAHEHHGFADLETQHRIDDNTIYHWASITKTLTGIAVMQLRDRGKLRLDDPVVRYLPELRRVHNPFGSMDAITIRQLMSHSAGFRNPTWPWGGDEPWHEHEPTEWSQLVAMMPYTEILFAPGSRYSYSNPGIIFLARIIELLTGDDFEVYADKNILKPLEMYRSYYDITPYHLLADRSNNYTVRGTEVTANGLDFDTGITTSNGGLNASVPDMLKYLAFLVGACDREACTNVLKRSSLEEMWKAVVPVQPAGYGGETSFAPGWSVAMGLTFFVYEQGGTRVIGHTGSQKAFRSFFYIDPASGAAAIAAFNTTVSGPVPSTGTLFDRMRGRVFGTLFPLLR